MVSHANKEDIVLVLPSACFVDNNIIIAIPNDNYFLQTCAIDAVRKHFSVSMFVCVILKLGVIPV